MNNKHCNIFCPLCDNWSVNFFCEKNKYKLYKCKSCKLLFVYPIPKIVNIYNESYFSGAKNGFGYVNYDKDKEPMVSTFNEYLNIISSLGLSKGRLLDIGAATGFFMNIAQGKGFETTGIEVSEFVAEIGKEKGLDIFTNDDQLDKFSEEYFDVITMFDVLEHLENPKETLSKLYRVLKKGGLLVINTPDAESLWARVLGSRWQLILPPEHLYYFSPKNLSEYLQKHGFKQKVNTKIGKRFTFQYIFKMLYKWQGGFWNILTSSFSKGFLSKLYLPINLRDNFFIILEKKS